jgi:hypothetical protein
VFQGNNISINIYREKVGGCFNFVVDLVIGDLWFVLFENEFCFAESISSRKYLIFDHLELVKIDK